MKVLLQNHLHPGHGAVVIHGGGSNAPPSGGQIKGLAEEPAPRCVVEEQRVGVPDAGGLGQRHKGAGPQGGQQVAALRHRGGTHRNGVNFLVSGKFFQQPLRGHMQRPVELIH